MAMKSPHIKGYAHEMLKAFPRKFPGIIPIAQARRVKAILRRLQSPLMEKGTSRERMVDVCGS